MTITIVTDLLDPSCNSYADLASMEAYLSDRVADDGVSLELWLDLTVDQQTAYLLNATRSIDSMVEWIGDRYSHDQRLRWPRINALFDGFYIDPPSLPRQVVEATCEMALWLMQNSGGPSVQQDSTFSAIKVGPIRIDYNPSTAGAADKYVPDSVSIILKGLGTVTGPELPGSRQLKTVRLIRA